MQGQVEGYKQQESYFKNCNRNLFLNLQRMISRGAFKLPFVISPNAVFEYMFDKDYKTYSMRDLDPNIDHSRDSILIVNEPPFEEAFYYNGFSDLENPLLGLEYSKGSCYVEGHVAISQLGTGEFERFVRRITRAA